MESENQTEPQSSTSNTGYIFSNEDYLSTLIRSNAHLRDELEESRRKQHQSNCQLVAAKRTICELRSQLEETRGDSGRNLTSLVPKLDMAEQRAKAAADVSTVESTKPCQAVEMDLSSLVQQLQKAHRNLGVCTVKRQSRADNTKDCDQEHSEKVQVLKNGIMNLGVKLQQEKVTLLKKAIALVPCNTEGQGNKNWSAQAEDLEKVNLQIQKINLELLQQALCLQSGGYQKKAPPKHHWIRVHKDQEQQTEQLETTAERQFEQGQENVYERVTDDQKEIAALQLKDKLHAEVDLKVEMKTTELELEAELHRKTLMLEETKSQVLKHHDDQEPQVDQSNETTERKAGRGQRNSCEEADKKQEDKEALLSEIQLLEERLTVEEANNQTNTQDPKSELLKKVDAVKEVGLKVHLLQKELLRISEEAQAQMIQVDHLKKVNKAISAQRRRAEELLQVRFKQWQEERSSLITAIQELHELLYRKQLYWSKQERDMVARLEHLEKRMAERLGKKSKKRRSWLDQGQQQPSTGDTGYFFTYEDYLSTLIRSNDRLRDELEERQRKLLLSDYQLEAAKRCIIELRNQLEEARGDSDKNLTRAKATADLSTVESTNPCQAVEMDLPTLVQQLQKAHRNLEVCTAKLQSSAASTEDCDQEYSEKVQVLKNGIMNLGVKLQQEKVTLLKKAITLVPCNTEAKATRPEDSLLKRQITRQRPRTWRKRTRL
ncbi:hypothetical protein Q5P01_005777 [Channa striata]|uniref:Uncharacterized protein n=1 Tax=Channa striata TaxID=64152 RepID=A0AA88NEL5_CHASR|nr:hypothetical protein Q5P01_005777 [Channa striata]